MVAHASLPRATAGLLHAAAAAGLFLLPRRPRWTVGPLDWPEFAQG